MQMTKKMIAGVVVALTMALCLAATAFAATTQDMSITNAKDGSTYKAFQVMTAEQVGTDNDGKALYAYTVSDDFAGFFKDGANGYTLDDQNQILKDGKVVAGDDRWTNTNATDAAALASALEKYAVAKGIKGTAVSSAAAALPEGFYVVAETVSTEDSTDDSAAKEIATKPILVNLTGAAAEITLKDDTTTLEKKIVEGGKLVDTNNVNIGDDVDYQINTKIPTYEANVDTTKLMFKLTDTFSEGLTYNDDIAIEGFTKDTDYTATLDGQVLTIEFTPAAIAAHQGEAVKATYSAKLNDKAKVDSTEGNPNTVKLEYTNNTNEEESHKTLNDETKTFTYGFNVHKVDKVAPSTGLADAKFELKDKDGNVVKFDYDKATDTYTVNPNGTVTEIVSVGGEGLATVKGLDEGTYTLTETQAPDEYTKLSEPVTVTIADKKDANGDNTGVAVLTAGGAGNAKGEGGTKVVDGDGNETGSVESDGSTININVYVENAKGISLPETGAMTALYCMVGGMLLVVAGAAYYLVSRRASKSNR
ncbi:Predicted outer membrane protein [Slackia heliotrinireducens]|uniref:Putative collagen-binding protein n=1 Tax=Slackia heliotrinireducens (strain ATCC 29202 / DSM 20476 / NCTC 11029 / RHS 1) TaxID=471855 RepID=C7N1Z9_SLAHD|nr:isopeptide-forming domain-containing fimbrial protein [Slackia heliotrinireducens]ACV23440.1 putative collagen-binding protein [Slackia heliotrinireducens DSM 20476]VEH02748.1 Predicted outer membrane protein [Slackia heliotrinireducens]